MNPVYLVFLQDLLSCISAKCAVLDKVLLKKPVEDLVETKQVLRTDAARCIELQSENTLSAMLIEKRCGFITT